MIQKIESNERITLPDFLINRGEYFDIRNLTDEELSEFGEQYMTDEEWEDFERTGLSTLSEEEYNDFALYGKLPDGWEASDEEDVRTSGSTIDLYYERSARTAVQQREDYLLAKKMLLPVQKRIQQYRQNCYAATAIIFVSSGIAGAAGVNQQNPLPLQVGMGSAAVVAFGIRSNARRKSEQIQLNKQLRLLEEITTGYEFVHLSEQDQQFYKENNIPIDVHKHTVTPVYASDLDSLEPTTQAEKIAARVGDSLELVLHGVRELLM